MWTFTLSLKISRTDARKFMWRQNLDLEGLHCGWLPFDKQNLKPFEDHCILTPQYLLPNYSFPQIRRNHLYSVDNIIFYRICFKLRKQLNCMLYFADYGIQILVIGFFFPFYNLNQFNFYFSSLRGMIRRNDLGKLSNNILEKENNCIYHHVSSRG